MKLKLLTVFLGTTTLLFGMVVCFFFIQINRCEETIADRELTIMSYKKVVDAIGRSGAISVENLKSELGDDFNITREMGYNDHSDERYTVVHLVSREVNPMQMWNFMGLQLVFDNQKALKSVNLYKP